jgi:hypothetical protein
MFRSNDLLVEVLMREREREARKAVVYGALRRGANPKRDRRRSLRERLGISLIQAGRALLRHGTAYASVPRRLA